MLFCPSMDIETVVVENIPNIFSESSDSVATHPQHALVVIMGGSIKCVLCHYLWNELLGHMTLPPRVIAAICYK